MREAIGARPESVDPPRKSALSHMVLPTKISAKLPMVVVEAKHHDDSNKRRSAIRPS